MYDISKYDHEIKASIYELLCTLYYNLQDDLSIFDSHYL